MLLAEAPACRSNEALALELVSWEGPDGPPVNRRCVWHVATGGSVLRGEGGSERWVQAQTGLAGGGTGWWQGCGDLEAVL